MVTILWNGINKQQHAGRGLGTTIGAVTVASAHGIRSGYLVFGILAAVTSVAYLISYHSCLKKMEIKRLEPVKTTDSIYFIIVIVEM